MGRISNRLPNHGTVVAYLALFVAVATGGAYAADNLIGSKDIAKNAVKSKHIGKGQVKNADLAADAVTSPKVANGSLLGEDFAAGQLPQGAQGAQGARGAEGAQGARGPAGATNVTVRSATIFGSSAPVLVQCNAGERAVGGGVDAPAEGDVIFSSTPSPQSGTPTGWLGGIIDRDSGQPTSQGTVYVVCAAP